MFSRLDSVFPDSVLKVVEKLGLHIGLEIGLHDGGKQSLMTTGKVADSPSSSLQSFFGETGTREFGLSSLGELPFPFDDTFWVLDRTFLVV